MVTRIIRVSSIALVILTTRRVHSFVQQWNGEAVSNSNSHSNSDSIGNKRYAWVWLNHMDVRISHHLNPLSQTNEYKDIKSSGSIMLISQTWHAHKRKDTKLFEQKTTRGTHWRVKSDKWISQEKRYKTYVFYCRKWSAIHWDPNENDVEGDIWNTFAEIF